MRLHRLVLQTQACAGGSLIERVASTLPDSGGPAPLSLFGETVYIKSCSAHRKDGIGLGTCFTDLRDNWPAHVDRLGR